MKFALHNYAGQPVRFFTVEAQDVESNKAEAENAPSHHIAILDVSGSMWGDLDSVKNIIEKVFTAEEFNDPAMKISLVTYSSHGDCRVHFKRVTVEDVLAPNSPHLAEIRNLRVRGLTGMSQALVTAETLIDDTEATCISLHTDGYANDPSPYAEAQGIVAAVEAIERHPNVFCNTVGYRSWCDFALLAAIANRLSGTSMQAANAREVYKALHSAQTLLAGSMSPVLEAGIGLADFITFVSQKGGKVLGGTKSIQVRGLSSDDDAMVYRYKEISEARYNVTLGPICDGLTNPVPLLAYAKAQIALGNLNDAKFAMVSTRLGGLIKRNARALVASEVADMAADVEGFLFETNGQTEDDIVNQMTVEYGLGETGPSILSLLQVLNTYRSTLRVNVDALAKGYQRRGLKRIAGVRNDKGEIEPPTHKLMVERGTDPLVDVSGIDINRDTATVNIRLVDGGTLVTGLPADPTHATASAKIVTEVAGIKLDLKSYRNYTIVGDGKVNVEVLPLRIGDKRCFAALKEMGLVDGQFDPEGQYDIKLGEMPLVDYDQSFSDTVPDLYEELVKLTVLQKLLSGLTAGTSEALTGEQIAALKECYISPALYFTPPTTVPYADLKAALSAGEVDTYLSYTVKIGAPSITNIGTLKSGNAYLQRRFTLKLADGTVVKKPKFTDWWQDDNTWGIKPLSARTKLDAVDEVMFPIYANFLRLEGWQPMSGLTDGEPLADLLLSLGEIDGGGGDDSLLGVFEQVLMGGEDREGTLTVFKSILRLVNNAIDVLYEGEVCPLAFFVGATGLVPESFGAAMTADQLVTKYPAVKLVKAEKEGTFYDMPGRNDMILGVFVKAEHFTTERGLKAAADLAG